MNTTTKTPGRWSEFFDFLGLLAILGLIFMGGIL